MVSLKFLIIGLALLLSAPLVAAAQIWQPDTSSQARGGIDGTLFRADDAALRDALDAAGRSGAPGPMQRIELPLPDGRVASFHVVESSVMAPGLAAKYPEIRAFRVFGIDDATVRGRIDISPRGFHGIVETADGLVLIDPRGLPNPDNVYLSRYRQQQRRGFHCAVHGAHSDLASWLAPQLRNANRTAGNLQQYDIAIAVTNEYYVDPALGNGSDILTTAAINTTLTRVNFVYERDLGITLQLVAANDTIYEDTDTGLLDNETPAILLGQIDAWIDARLPGGDTAYDIGHVFSKPSGPFASGIARIGAACQNAFKASGVSGSPVPSGDAFDIDLVAHEIGHQFSAEHSFNGTTGSCEDNRSATTAYEPGSGSTIMAYAGICGAENLQSNSEDAFHAGSIAQIDAFTAAGGGCFTLVANGNADPALGAIGNVTIPADTPFVLDVTNPTTDADGDPLEYQWDQLDAGCSTDATTFGADNGSNALFRSYAPRAESWRNFPALGTQLGNDYDKAEVLACHDRVLDFRLTVRDGASGQDTEDVRVTVDSGSGPFAITMPNTAQTITSPGPITVAWNKAGTDASPVSCPSVDIDLLTFAAGYATYSIHPLVAGTPNDELEMVTIPVLLAPNSNARARIRVKCSNNVFYDISDADLDIDGTDPTPISYDDDDFRTRFNLGGTLTGSAPVCGPIVDCTPPPPTDPGKGVRDATAIDWHLLALLFVLFGLRARRT